MEATQAPERAFENPAHDAPASAPLGPRERQALDELWVQSHGALVGKAKRMMMRLQISPVQCEAEDAVDGAVLRLSSEANRQMLASADGASLVKLFSAILSREILDVADYLARRRRGGAAGAPSGHDGRPGETASGPGQPPDRGHHRQEMDLEELSLSGPSFEAEVIADDDFETLLGQLDDPLLREIVIMRLDGLSRGDIAIRLGISERTVQRKMAIIREVFERLERE